MRSSERWSRRAATSPAHSGGVNEVAGESPWPGRSTAMMSRRSESDEIRGSHTRLEPAVPWRRRSGSPSPRRSNDIIYPGLLSRPTAASTGVAVSLSVPARPISGYG
jgi:hypothetical protein